MEQISFTLNFFLHTWSHLFLSIHLFEICTYLSNQQRTFHKWFLKNIYWNFFLGLNKFFLSLNKKHVHYHSHEHIIIQSLCSRRATTNQRSSLPQTQTLLTVISQTSSLTPSNHKRFLCFHVYCWQTALIYTLTRLM